MKLWLTLLVNSMIFLSCVDCLPGKTLLLGDFNVHADCPEKPDVSKFFETISSFNFRSLVFGPTHISGHTLDLILSRADDLSVCSLVIDPPIFSDHSIIHANVLLPKLDALTPVPYTSRNFKSIDHDVFGQDLSIKVAEIMACGYDDLDNLVLHYNSACKKVLDQHAPAITRHQAKRKKPKWYDDNVADARKSRRRAERRWRKRPTVKNKNIFVAAQAHVNTTIEASKRKNINSRIINGTIKDMYSIVNELLDKGIPQLPDSSLPQQLADNFCGYFVQKAQSVRDEIDGMHAGHHDKISDCQVSSTLSCFTPISESDLCEVIMKSSSASCPSDPIPTWLVKKHISILLPTLTLIVNLSLTLGYFPSQLKKAIITPVLKKHGLDKEDLSNYRPISNLAYIGKLIEKVVSTQLSAFVDIHHLVDPFQSAYRRYHSTETALIRVHNDILRAVDRKKAVFLIMLDLSSAFDTIDTGILLHRLEHNFGFIGTIKSWFKSYFSNRSCCVRIFNSFSNSQRLAFGVPQGSVIGPQAFTFYIRDVGRIVDNHSINYHVYADDIQLLLSFDPNIPGDAICSLHRLSECIKDLQSWMSKNKLKLNNKKTEFFIASSAHHYRGLKHLTLNLGEQAVQPTSSVRNLGVLFDPEMKMSGHITQLSRTVNRQLRGLYRLRKYIDFDTCHNVVRTLLLSRIDYCNVLFNNISKGDLQRLQKLQNRCARFIFRLPKFHRASPLLRKLHWLPIGQRIIFRTLSISFCAINDQARTPDYLSSLLSKRQYPHGRNLRSAASLCLDVPRSYKKAGDRAFSIASPKLWNALPSNLKNASCHLGFRRLLKQNLFP